MSRRIHPKFFSIRNKIVKAIFAIFIVIIVIGGIQFLISRSTEEVYKNNEIGFQLALPRGVYKVNEEYGADGACFYFNSKKILNANEGYDGTVFRIEITDKTKDKNYADSIQCCKKAYGLEILSEDQHYIIGWAHATDVQYPEEYAEYYQTLRSQSESIIQTFHRK